MSRIVFTDSDLLEQSVYDMIEKNGEILERVLKMENPPVGKDDTIVTEKLLEEDDYRDDLYEILYNSLEKKQTIKNVKRYLKNLLRDYFLFGPPETIIPLEMLCKYVDSIGLYRGAVIEDMINNMRVYLLNIIRHISESDCMMCMLSSNKGQACKKCLELNTYYSVDDDILPVAGLFMKSLLERYIRYPVSDMIIPGIRQPDVLYEFVNTWVILEVDYLSMKPYTKKLEKEENVRDKIIMNSLKGKPVSVIKFNPKHVFKSKKNAPPYDISKMRNVVETVMRCMRRPTSDYTVINLYIKGRRAPIIQFSDKGWSLDKKKRMTLLMTKVVTS